MISEMSFSELERRILKGQWWPVRLLLKGDKKPILVYGDDKHAVVTQTGGRYAYGGDPVFEYFPPVWEGDNETGGYATIDFKPTHWSLLSEPDLDKV